MSKIRFALLAVAAACLATSLAGPAHSAPSPNTAASTAPPRVTDYGTGWTAVRDPAPYLLAERYRTVIHVDSEHMTEDGFWYAASRSHDDVRRGFTWFFKPWGVKCQTPAAKVVFNPWTNFYSCLLDVEEVDELDPGYVAVQTTADCRDRRPWTYGYAQEDGTTACFDGALQPSWAGLETPPSVESFCAPWEEEQAARETGDLLKCTEIRYPWDRAPEGLPWVSAPDACTGAPADLQTGPYIPQRNVPDNAACDGSADAPNCVPETADNPACGGPLPEGVKVGWPELTPDTATHTAVVEVEATGQTAKGTATATVTRTVTFPGRTVEVVAKRRVGARAFQATGSAAYKSVSVTETRTASVEWTQGAIGATAFGVCTATYPQQATECATARATDQAVQESTRFAQIRGESDAQRRAYESAASNARTRAVQLAGWERESAHGRAKYLARERAERALDAMVRKYLAGK